MKYDGDVGVTILENVDQDVLKWFGSMDSRVMKGRLRGFIR